MSNFMVGDIVQYRFREEAIGVILEKYDSSRYRINWFCARDITTVYSQNWVGSGDELLAVSNEQYNEFPQVLKDALCGHKPKTLQERVCSKIKELDAKWEQRMAQKKVPSPTMNPALNVGVETMLPYTLMDTSSASGVTSTSQRLTRNGYALWYTNTNGYPLYPEGRSQRT